MRVTIIAGALVFAALAHADEDTMRAHCAQRWPGNYQMQGFCLDQQRAALARIQARDADAAPMPTVRAHCAQRWPGAYDLRDRRDVFEVHHQRLERVPDLCHVPYASRTKPASRGYHTSAAGRSDGFAAMRTVPSSRKIKYFTSALPHCPRTPLA
jgi:hypothetical protein